MCIKFKQKIRLCNVALNEKREIIMNTLESLIDSTHINFKPSKKATLIALSCIAFLGIFTMQQLVFAADMESKPSAAVFSSDGNLKRPAGYREWIFVGTPLTPNDMNDGKAAFPEFHNVYIDPASWAYWKDHGEFRDGTILVKELVSVGSKSAASGKGYFEGEYLGLEATVKDSKHFPKAPGNWAYFRFTNDDYKGLKLSSAALPHEACAFCHQANAKQDFVFTQHYPVLRAGKSAGKAAVGGL